MRTVIHRLTVRGAGYEDTLTGIMRFFLEEHGWRNCYHLLVFEDRVEQWASLDIRGAHAAPHNTGSWGVAIIGDWRKASPPERQYRLAYEAVGALHWLDGTYPATKLYRDRMPYFRCSGHGELPGIGKDCPGAGIDMSLFRADVLEMIDWYNRELGSVPPRDRRQVFGWR